MLCGTPPPGTEAGRSTDFNILVHLERIGDSRLTPRLGPWLPGREPKAGYVENLRPDVPLKPLVQPPR
jgi:hypothetical protein